MTTNILVTVLKALGNLRSGFWIVFLSAILGLAEARAGADFIGGQANADEDVSGGPESVEGGFDERARTMQQWLRAREDERREMGVAHVYERPKAIEDNYDHPHNGHGYHSSRSSGHVRWRSSVGAGTHRGGLVRVSSGHASISSGKHGGGRSAISQVSSKSGPTKRAATSMTKHAGKSAKRHH